MNASTDFAYAAGYIDGDGCFFIGEIKNSPFFQDTFSIISTDLENIEWFKSNFDGTIQIKTTKQKNRRQSYHFVFSKNGYDTLENIEPFLIEKEEECRIFRMFKNPIFKDERKELVKIMRGIKDSFIPCSIKDNLEPIKNTIKPSIEDFAYLAGFVDAECSLGIIKRKLVIKGNPIYRAQLQMSNTKPDVFYWISERFGGQFHFDERSKKNKKWKNQMIWRISNSMLFPILENILPFLKHKKPVCEKLIEFQKNIASREGNISPAHSRYQEFYAPILQHKESIYQKVRHLNKTV